MKKRTFIILAVIVLAFIWGHSLIPTDASTEESGGIMRLMQGVLDFLHIPVTLTEHAVRKLAHFTEHAVAGIVLSAFLYPKLSLSESRRERIDSIVLPLTVGFFVGFIDETIQIFSGRGPMVEDVWIDFAGIFLGVFIVILLTDLKRRSARKHMKNDEK